MKSFKEMLDSKNDAELGAMCRDRYERLIDAHGAGIADEHPVATWNADNVTLRAHRAAKDAAGSGLGARELEENDQPGAQDDPPERTPGTPPNPQRPGAALAAHDSVLEELAIRQRGGAQMDSELHAARVRRMNVTPESVRAMTEAVPGYGRLK